MRSQDSDWATDWKIGFRIPAAAIIYSLLEIMKTNSEAHPSAFPMGKGGSGVTLTTHIIWHMLHVFAARTGTIPCTGLSMYGS